MAGKKHCLETKRREQPLETSILDDFSPVKLKKILPTSAKKSGDVLNSFRPNKGECLSYDISQTVLKMEAGDVKINLKNTKATFVPAPPVTPKKKKKVTAPPYKFINEIWLENKTALEEQYKEENRRFFKEKKKQNRIKAEKIHHFVLSMGGPDWFQELSPNQLRTVNQLECCILKDVKANTITNVQENIANLGLVLRPNHRHIEKALHLCRKNPVEFLLILYQIMNPKRKVYSLNDRLLLSAVTHLCMTHTLRELHVRIPSPPVRRRVRRIKPKVEKKVKYPSPYLEPLFFTPVPPECTGVYENPHIQYPESPYFSYLQTMHIDRFMAEDVLELDLAKFNAGEVELYQDMKRAQILYNQIRKGKRVKLLKPTIMEKYEMPIKKKRISLKLPLLSILDDPEEICICGEVKTQDNDPCCEYDTILCKCQGKCDCEKKSRTFTCPKCGLCVAREREKRTQRIIKGITVTRDNEAVPVIEGTLPQQICDCLQKYKDDIVAVKARNLLQCQKAKYIIGGVAMTRGGPIYILSTALKKVKKKIVIDPNLSEQIEERDEAVQEAAEGNGGEPKSHEISTNTKGDTNENDSSSRQSDDADCECKKKSNIYKESACAKCELKRKYEYGDRIVEGLRNTSFKGVRLFQDTPSSGWLESPTHKSMNEGPVDILSEENDEAVLEEQLESALNKTIQETAKENGGEPKSHEKSTNTKGDTNENDSSSRQSDDADCECKKKSNIYKESACAKCELKRKYEYGDRIVEGLRNTSFKGVRLFQDTPSSGWLESPTDKSMNESPVDILSEENDGAVLEEQLESALNKTIQETAKENGGEPKSHEKSRNTKGDTNENDSSSRQSDDADCDCKRKSNIYKESACAKCELKRKYEYGDRIVEGLRNTSFKGVRLFQDTPSSGWLESPTDKSMNEGPVDILSEENDEAVLEEQLESALNKTIQEAAEGNGGEPKSHEKSTNTKGDTNENDSSSRQSDDADCDCKKKSNIYKESACVKCELKRKYEYGDRIVEGLRNTSFKGVRLFQDTPSSGWLESSIEKTISTEPKNKTQSQEAQLVIDEATSTNEDPAHILSTSILDRKVEAHSRTKRSSRKGKAVTVEDEEETKEEVVKYSGCKCRQELERFLNHECTCEECKERIKKEVIHIISGTTCINDKNAVNIIQGIYEQRCDCLAKYKEKINRLDDYRKRIEARYNLKSQTLKFSIGGVVNGPNGPVYVITGMRSPVECECAKAARRKEEEEQQSRQMARMPATGRIKYQITGVRNTPEGNVFIISQALAIDECDCVKLYDTFTQAHRACLDMYENYLRQTNQALEEYVYKEVENNSQEEPDVSEVTELTEQAWREGIDMHELQIDNSFSHYNLFEKGEVVRGINPKCSGQKLDICNKGEVISLSGDSVISECCEDDNEEETLSDSSEESQQCENIRLQDSKSGDMTVEKEKPVQVKAKQEFKRFVILKKIPSDYKKQLRILKKVLATMAEDDFPLAKLPDCHKLPHFKLWMAMRCGKFWTQKEINSLVPFSKRYWYHTGMCPIHYRVPSLGITRKEANEMTWNQAQYIKKIVADKTDAFYREINQNTVENAREFFPMSFSYEFPNKTFRDVFFSYLPAKERDTLAYHVMKPHDMRVISKRYSCYC